MCPDPGGIMGRTDILCGTSGIFTSTGLVLLNLAKGRHHSILVQTSGISDPGRAFDAVWVKVRQAGQNCRLLRNVKPRIDGPWFGDPTSVTGT